jgi:uncharacterized protein DUF6788
MVLILSDLKLEHLFKIGDMKKRRVNLTKIQQQREKMLQQIKVPADALPGSLSVSRLRCGKANCHCSQDEGHENWTLTYMVDGKKRIKHIPQDLVEYVRQKVDHGKAFKDALNQILLANIELLVLLRKQKQRT